MTMMSDSKASLIRYYEFREARRYDRYYGKAKRLPNMDEQALRMFWKNRNLLWNARLERDLVYPKD